jgi:hypothetical protein
MFELEGQTMAETDSFVPRAGTRALLLSACVTRPRGALLAGG